MAEQGAAEDGEGPACRQVYVQDRAGRSRRFQTTVDEVTAFFATCGKPRSIVNKFGEEPADGRLREVAFVSFKKNKAVQKAIAMSGSTLAGHVVAVGLNSQPPKRRGAVQTSVRIFVGNLPAHPDGGGAEALEPELRELFSSAAKVLFVRFPEGYSHYCHVILEDDGSGDAARRAIALDGTELHGQALNVGAAVAKQKRKRPPREPDAPAADGQGQEARARNAAAKRPAEWRFDRAAGLTKPRHSKAASGTAYW